jgi:hypothetical protein
MPTRWGWRVEGIVHELFPELTVRIRIFSVSLADGRGENLKQDPEHAE